MNSPQPGPRVCGLPLRPAQITWGGAALIVAGVLATYLRSIHGPFVFDDASSIAGNATLRHLWPLWDVLATPTANVTAQGRPVLNLSLAINFALGGTAVEGYRIVNLVIHMLAGLALQGVVRRTLTGSPSGRAWLESVSGRGFLIGDAGTAAALLAASIGLLWTLHPLHTESVSYVIQRAESLMGLFYLLTFYCFIRAVEPVGVSSGVSWRGLAVLCCALGMATKEVMVTAPVMVLLYDRAFVAGSFRRAWNDRRGLYLALAATWLVLFACMARGGGNRGGTIGLGVGVSFWEHGLTQFEAIGRYLLLSVWPAPLVFEYGAFRVRHWVDALPWMLIVGPMLAAALWAFWRRPLLGFCGAWFFAILAPSSVVPGTSQMIVEHRLYLPLAAAVVVAVCAGYSLLVRVGVGAVEQSDDPAPRAIASRGTFAVGAAVVALALALGLITARRNDDYRSALTLWADTVAKRPLNGLAHHMLAEELLEAGRVSEAEAHYREAVRLDSGLFPAHERLGEVLARRGQAAEAAACFETALRLRPDFADALDNYGALLSSAGRHEEALALIQRALELRPDYAEAHYNLAGVLERLHRLPEAVAHLESAVKLKPEGFPAALYNLANLLTDLGRAAEALPHYERALALRPSFPDAEYNLANALAMLRRGEEAIPHYRRTLELKPDHAAAEMNLGSVLFGLGRLREAEEHYLAALRIDPAMADARENLARVRAAQRR
jgi:tetratricopeptide (TPR) repeat protein